MTSPDNSTLRPDLRTRAEEAQVQDDEAKARKAAADAATSELTLTQARYKALVPDLTGVVTNAVADKSADLDGPFDATGDGATKAAATEETPA
jgi:hypothetical protein